MYSSISCSVCALICLPLSSELASLKSNNTRHWLSFLTNSCDLSDGGTSDQAESKDVANGEGRTQTVESGKLFDFGLFCHNKTAASLFTRWLTDNGDRISRTRTVPIKRVWAWRGGISV